MPEKPSTELDRSHLNRKRSRMAPEERRTPKRLQALIIHPEDNVANLVGPGRKGGSVESRVEGRGSTEMIELVEDLPSNHKLARRDIAAGESITKYGLSIGKATREIGRGEHVHVHNMESNRGRGDLQP